MKALIFIVALLVLVGCGGSSSSPPTNGVIKETLFTDVCQQVPELYYKEQSDTWSYLEDTKDLWVYWDLRYHIPYVTTLCDNGLKFSATVDLSQWYTAVDFGGPQSTIIYNLNKYDKFPWRTGDNLSMQVKMKTPYFKNLNGKTGGNIAFNFFIVNPKTNARLNYVISIYTLGVANQTEVKEVLYDTSTNTNFISTTIQKGNLYTTISDLSSSTNIVTQEFNFFRVNVTRENLTRIIDNPEDYKVTFIGIQYEIEEELGEAIVSTPFYGFSAYITSGAI